MEKSVERTQRTYIRLTFGSFALLILLIALIWGGHDVYARWQEKRLIRRAHSAFDKGDYRTASLAVRTALNFRPNSVGATRMMAQIGERARDKGALDWRRKVVQLVPGSAGDILEWARSALLFDDLQMAERALGEVPESAKDSAGYHAVSAMIAQARHEDDKAEREWQEATRLAPNEEAYRLQLGMVEVRSSDPARHATGEKRLQQLQEDPRFRIAATRALITEGVRRRQSGLDLVALAQKLQSYPEAALPEKILYLDFMHQVNDPGFSAYLTGLEKSTAGNPAELAQLLSWMSLNNQNLVAVDFLKTVPREILDRWPAQLAVAEIYLNLKDWPQLVARTQNTKWRQDFLRQAFLANALRAQDKRAAAEHEWAAAVKEASNDSSSLISLITLTSQWHWDTERIDLLWALTKHPDKQKEALATLYRYFAENKDTQGLYRLLLRLAETDPSSLEVQNNLAQVSLLLNVQREDAQRSAASVYQKEPGNPAYASTYAYSLLTKGRVKEAQNVMAKLSKEQLKDPAVSAYYGLCLAASNDPRARTFLEAGQRASLLPEEKALVDKALRRSQE